MPRIKHNKRLLGFYNEEAREFYFRLQNWNENKQCYETEKEFCAERVEVEGLKTQYKYI